MHVLLLTFWLVLDLSIETPKLTKKYIIGKELPLDMFFRADFSLTSLPPSPWKFLS